MPIKLEPAEAKRRRQERHRAWVEKNSERVKAYQRAYRISNKVKSREYDREYYRTRMPMWRKLKKWDSLKAHAKQNPNYSREYYELNKVEAHLRVIKRRITLRNNFHHSASLEAISEIYYQCRLLNDSCDSKYAVDHIIPLSKGGFHHELNLQIIPASLNKSKGNKIFWETEGYKSWKDVPDFLWPESLKSEYKKKYGQTIAA